MISSKNKIYIIFTTASILFLVLIIFGAIPFLGEIKQSSQNLISQRSLLNLIDARITEVAGFQDNRSQLRQDLSRIESVFIEEDSPVVFLNYLEKTAEATNLSIKIYPNPTNSALTDLWSSIGLRLSINGDVKDCLRFLEILERSKWMFEVSYFSLDKTSGISQYSSAFKDLEEGDAYMSIVVKAYSGEPLL